jgi:hypothetical protein
MFMTINLQCSGNRLACPDIVIQRCLTTPAALSDNVSITVQSEFTWQLRKFKTQLVLNSYAMFGQSLGMP